MADTDNSESEPTQKLTPFQTMVLGRFDQLDARFDKTDERLDKLEARFDKTDERLDQLEARFDKTDERLHQLEAKTYDTKPIWERALAEILEVKTEVLEVKAGLASAVDRLDKVERGIRVLNDNILEVRADLKGHEDRIAALESKPRQ